MLKMKLIGGLSVDDSVNQRERCGYLLISGSVSLVVVAR
jgi:hypothetical protein